MAGPGHFKIETDNQPKSGNKKNRKTPIDQKNRPGKSHEAVLEKKKAENQQGADTDSFNNIDQIRNAGIAPHPPIQIKKIKTGDFDYQNIRQYPVKRS
jgi:hypothetical protein